jgi:hypothetical protein
MAKSRLVPMIPEKAVDVLGHGIVLVVASLAVEVRYRTGKRLPDGEG